MTIKEITLLSEKDFRQYQSIIPNVDACWWLSNVSYGPSYSRVYTIINRSMGLKSCDNSTIGVRPALKLNLEISDSLFWYKPEKLIGTQIEYGQYTWTVLDANFGEIYALCDDIIARRRFDSTGNIWSKSELNQWLETEGLKLITK